MELRNLEMLLYPYKGVCVSDDISFCLNSFLERNILIWLLLNGNDAKFAII